MKTIPLKPESLDTLRKAHTPLKTAEAAVPEAEQKLEAAREDLRRREEEVERLPAEVAASRASPSALEKALRLRDVAALMVPAAERAVAEARAAVEQTTEAAIAAFADSIRGRREKLRKELAGARVRDLARFVEADRQLCFLAESIHDVHGKDRLFGLDLGQLLTWPQCFRDEVRSLNAARMVGGIGVERSRARSPLGWVEPAAS